MTTAQVVASERPIIRTRRYDLGVYRAADYFYSSWFCDRCPARGDTEGRADQETSHADGMAALDAHDKECHAG